MNIQFKIIQEKKNDAGIMPVALFSYLHGKRLVFYTEISCKDSEFDTKCQRLRKSFLNSTQANIYLDSLEQRAKQTYSLPFTLRLLIRPITF
jgi:Arm DNA-binding domain